VAAPAASAAAAAAGGDGKGAASDGAQAAVRARALFSYKANPSDPHEISLEKDEVVTILDRKGNWWRARKEDGTLGIVPSNYMEVI
jgi:SHO1 osmosensor